MGFSSLLARRAKKPNRETTGETPVKFNSTTTLNVKFNSTTTLNRIREKSPCQDGWTKLLAHIGKTKADDEPLDLITVLDSNGLEDALWVLSYAMPDDRLARHFQAWAAEQVLHLFEENRPNDKRVREQIAMLRNDKATPDERDAARAEAWDAARAAARAAALDAARNAALAAARNAAYDAALASAYAAARNAARGATICAQSGVEARDAQEKQLREMIG